MRIRPRLFHSSTGDPVTFLVCLHCADISVVRNGKQVGFGSFSVGRSEVEALAREIFPQDNDIRALIEDRESERRKVAESDSRWRAAMPKCVQPLWDEASADPISPNLKPLRKALLKELPDESRRILAMLTWFGSGDGLWSGFPSYEVVPENCSWSSQQDESSRQLNRQLLASNSLKGQHAFSRDGISLRTEATVRIPTIVEANLTRTFLEKHRSRQD